MRASPPRVALVAMPWRRWESPDLHTPSLRALLMANGYAADDYHVYLDVAAALGVDRYNRIYKALAYAPVAQDALYAALLFPERRAAIIDVLLDFNFPEAVGKLLDEWQTLHAAIFAGIDWASYDLVLVVGNGSISAPDYHYLANAYAARAIKDLAPAVQVGLAGPDVAGDVGRTLLQTLTWVDFVINGEPEHAVLDLLAGQPDVPGVLVRQPDGTVPLSRSRTVVDLDALPWPDFSRYMAHPVLQDFPKLAISVASGRGCWWDRSDRDPALSCRFCSINVGVDGYRARAIPHVIEEIRTQVRRYGARYVHMVDAISRPKDAKVLYAAIADLDLDLVLVGVETHPSLPLDAYPILAKAGAKTIQFGLEALSSGLLVRMNKGVSAARVVATLRAITEAGLYHQGNLLVWYPGSTVDEVKETLDRLPLLLGYPPIRSSTVIVGAGSPLAEVGEAFGVLGQENARAYRRLLPPEIESGLRTMIRHVKVKGMPDWGPVLQFIMQWRAAVAADPAAIYHRCYDTTAGLVVERRGLNCQVFRAVLQGTARDVLLAAREPVKAEALPSRLPHLDAVEVMAAAAELTQLGIVALLDGVYVSLPVMLSGPPASVPVVAEAPRGRPAEAEPVSVPRRVPAEPLATTARTITGETVDLSSYKGNVVMIVNTASRCAFTPQYEELERLQRRWRDQGLRILAFPSNDFANQEPGDAEQIREFCTVRYDLTLDLFDKVHVRGPEQHPLFACLASGAAHPAMTGPPPWNFAKYLLDRGGKLVARFGPDVRPEDPALLDVLERLL